MSCILVSRTMKRQLPIIVRKLRSGLCISLVEADSQERRSIGKRSDRSQILAQPSLLLLWLALGAFPAWAQTGAGLSGVVTDQTGAAVSDVAVTIMNVDTGETRTIATD